MRCLVRCGVTGTLPLPLWSKRGKMRGFVAPHHKVFTAEYMGRGVKTEIESLRKRHSKICCRHLRTTFTVDAGRDDSSGIARTLATREEAGDRNAL